MQQRWLRALGPVLGLLLFVVALWALHHILAQYRYQDIIAAALAIAAWQIALAVLKIGEEAQVLLADFSLEGSAHKNHRAVLSKLNRAGCAFSVLAAVDVVPRLPRLKEVSDAWMGGKTVSEKGFSLGFFQADYLARCPRAIVSQNDEIIAFANLWLGGQRQELSIDLMRFVPAAPDGVMDDLLINLMLWGKAQGYARFNLGMAPLAGLESRSLAPLWNRFGALVFGHGEQFYNFQGLRQYKSKFHPTWEPRYLAVPNGVALPRILINLSTLIAGGLRGVIHK